MSNDDRQDKVLEIIRQIFDDRTQSVREATEALQSLQQAVNDEINMLVDALSEELGE